MNEQFAKFDANRKAAEGTYFIATGDMTALTIPPGSTGTDPTGVAIPAGTMLRKRSDSNPIKETVKFYAGLETGVQTVYLPYPLLTQIEQAAEADE